MRLKHERFQTSCKTSTKQSHKDLLKSLPAELSSRLMNNFNNSDKLKIRSKERRNTSKKPVSLKITCKAQLLQKSKR